MSENPIVFSSGPLVPPSSTADFIYSFTLLIANRVTMRWPSVFLATMAGLEAAQAHGDGPHVKVVMPRRRSLEELRQMRDSYETWNPPTAENKPQDGDEQILEARQATTAAGVANTTIPLGDNSMCGPGYGRCADGYCCSASG